ncbi:MAG: hypothetical protein U9R42_03780 [Bacteroidota bacterium]|nr:hypothetical protein [Bacteroidota bacterium]
MKKFETNRDNVKSFEEVYVPKFRNENPLGTKIINNLTALKTTAIQKNLCLASYSLSLFLKRNVFKEPP